MNINNSIVLSALRKPYPIGLLRDIESSSPNGTHQVIPNISRKDLSFRIHDAAWGWNVVFTSQRPFRLSPEWMEYMQKARMAGNVGKCYLVDSVVSTRTFRPMRKSGKLFTHVTIANSLTTRRTFSSFLHAQCLQLIYETSTFLENPSYKT
jgi:hypothetical protein